MNKIFHDFIIIEHEKSTGVLKLNNDEINSGIVKEFGEGYYTDSGTFVSLRDIKAGDKILFTQHLQIEDNGDKYYVVRSRDVIKVIANLPTVALVGDR